MAKDDLTARLDRLKKQQEATQREVDRIEGRRAQLLQQLYDQFKVKTLPAAQEKLEALQKDLERRRARADRLLTNLEAMVNGDA